MRDSPRIETRDEFRRALLALVQGPLRSQRATVRDPIDGATPLFESGVIDSLGVLELLAFVEGATGREIPARMVEMRHFGSVDRICDTFWRDRP
jgi:acyl carrier protein